MMNVAKVEQVKLYVPVSIAQFTVYEALAAELLRRAGSAPHSSNLGVNLY